MRLCLHVSIPRVCLVLREARRGYGIPGVGVAKGCELPRGSSAKAAMLSTVSISLALVWVLLACLFVCFLRLELMYPRLTILILLSPPPKGS